MPCAQHLTLVLSGALAFAACTSESKAPNPAIDLVSREASPAETGKAAALTAIQTADLVGDLHGFLQGSIPLLAAHSSGRGGISMPSSPTQLAFSAPAGCTANGSFGGGGIMLDHDCTMPSGRHTAGSLTVRFGAGCHPFGISIEHHLVVESSPGAGDEVRIDGSTDIGFGDGRLNLATTLESHVGFDGHAVDTSVAGCFILDHRALTLAMNGHVITSVDGVMRSVRIDDLQMSFCEGIPYTGTVKVDADMHAVEVAFDRSSPETAIVDVSVDGNTAHVELELLEVQRECAIRTGGGAPLMIDYASCGGCGQPPPPAPPKTGSPAGSAGGGPGI